MPLENCKHCNTLFQMTVSPLCPECFKADQENKREIFHYVHENPGVDMEEIAEKFDIPLKEIETILFSGSLGTANDLIASTCSRCGCKMTSSDRVGHFCRKCNIILEKQGNIERPDPKEQKKTVEFAPDVPQVDLKSKTSSASSSSGKESNGSSRRPKQQYGMKRRQTF